MKLSVSVDGQDREVQIADFDGTRVVAVVAPTSDEPMVTLVSEAESECVTEDDVACELTDAALDGTLEDLAAQVDDDGAFRLRPVLSCDFIIIDEFTMCYVCDDLTIYDCF